MRFEIKRKVSCGKWNDYPQSAGNNSEPTILIAKTDENYVVKMPPIGNNKRLGRDLRGIIGRRYNFGAHTNIFPLASRKQLWEVLLKHFHGYTACGPNGVFTIGEKK